VPFRTHRTYLGCRWGCGGGGNVVSGPYREVLPGVVGERDWNRYMPGSHLAMVVVG
jgi:hypothetical protein